MSEYRISITRPDERPVQLYPGGQSERDFVQTVTDAVLRKVKLERTVEEVVKQGVGIFKTEAQVRKAFDAVIRDVAGPQLRQAIRNGIRDVLTTVKADVKP